MPYSKEEQQPLDTGINLSSHFGIDANIPVNPYKTSRKRLEHHKLSTLAFYSILALIPFLLLWWNIMWTAEVVKEKLVKLKEKSSFLCSKIWRER